MNTAPLSKLRRRRIPIAAHGFTLLELLVVLAILAMIATFAGPQVFKWLSGAKSDSARIQIQNIGAAIDLYRLEVGKLPPDLEALVSAPVRGGQMERPLSEEKGATQGSLGQSVCLSRPR